MICVECENNLQNGEPMSVIQCGHPYHTQCVQRLRARLGRCSSCNERFHEIWPLFLTPDANVSRRAAEASHSVRNADIQPRLAEPPVRIIVLADRPLNVNQPQNIQHPRRENDDQRPAAIAPRRLVAQQNQRRRRRARRYVEYRYVRPLGRVRIRHQPSVLSYNILRCVVCHRTYHTNELPAQESTNIICSFECSHRA